MYQQMYDVNVNDVILHLNIVNSFWELKMMFIKGGQIFAWDDHIETSNDSWK